MGGSYAMPKQMWVDYKGTLTDFVDFDWKGVLVSCYECYERKAPDMGGFFETI
jgi:hypothetical protein